MEDRVDGWRSMSSSRQRMYELDGLFVQVAVVVAALMPVIRLQYLVVK